MGTTLALTKPKYGKCAVPSALRSRRIAPPVIDSYGPTGYSQYLLQLRINKRYNKVKSIGLSAKHTRGIMNRNLRIFL